MLDHVCSVLLGVTLHPSTVHPTLSVSEALNLWRD